MENLDSVLFSEQFESPLRVDKAVHGFGVNIEWYPYLLDGSEPYSPGSSR